MNIERITEMKSSCLQMLKRGAISQERYDKIMDEIERIEKTI